MKQDSIGYIEFQIFYYKNEIFCLYALAIAYSVVVLNIEKRNSTLHF
jgi:hypothetical protein